MTKMAHKILKQTCLPKQRARREEKKGKYYNYLIWQIKKKKEEKYFRSVTEITQHALHKYHCATYYHEGMFTVLKRGQSVHSHCRKLSFTALHLLTCFGTYINILLVYVYISCLY